MFIITLFFAEIAAFVVSRVMVSDTSASLSEHIDNRPACFSSNQLIVAGMERRNASSNAGMARDHGHLSHL